MRANDEIMYMEMRPKNETYKEFSLIYLCIVLATRNVYTITSEAANCKKA